MECAWFRKTLRRVRADINTCLCILRAQAACCWSWLSPRKPAMKSREEVEKEILEIVHRETRAWNAKDVGLRITVFHPDMVWPWPPNSDAHDPMNWLLVLGRFDAARWKKVWQDLFFFFNDTATTEIYTLSLHELFRSLPARRGLLRAAGCAESTIGFAAQFLRSDRKSTRLNSSHPSISYAVFCLKK